MAKPSAKKLAKTATKPLAADIAGGGVVRRRIHLRTKPEAVHHALSTNEGRARFWAVEAGEKNGWIDFRFKSGGASRGRVLQNEPPALYTIEYVAGRVVRFELDDDGRGGTDLLVTEVGVPGEQLTEVTASWTSLLFCLKAHVDHGVDLRDPEPSRTWDGGFVDGL